MAKLAFLESASFMLHGLVTWGLIATRNALFMQGIFFEGVENE